MKIRHLPKPLENFCLSFPGIKEVHSKSIFASVFLLFLLSNITYLEAQQQLCTPVILVDWPVNVCYPGNHADNYSEFTPIHNKSGGCSIVNPSILYKKYGNHACGIGRTGGDGNSLILGGFTNSGFYANSNKALRFKVEFGPNDNGMLSKLSFWNEAKSHVYANGSSFQYGNNYPRKFGIRVLKNGNEIFRQTGLSTNDTWTKRHIDFTSDPDFAYNGITVFEFELYAYSPVGNNYPNNLWNLDEFSLWGCCDGCDNVSNPGIISGNQTDCDGFDPNTIQSQVSASGGSGSPLEYLWQQRNLGSTSWIDIPATNQDSYDPPFISTSTEFRRLARRTLCPDYEASNIVTITVNDPPGATATVSGPITCKDGSVQLFGSSNSQNVFYSWTGPGGFTSNQQNPFVQEEGTYTLTVEDKITGCISTAQTWVLENKNVPSASAKGGEINCIADSVILMGSSTPPGVQFEWQGPNGFQIYAQNTVVFQPGNYMLIAMDTLNGCKDTAYATVSNNTNPPGATATGGILGCNQNSLQIMGSSGTAGVSYSWTGPGGFSSNQQNPTVSVAGTYTLTVTDPTNGCSSTDTAIVDINANVPGALATGGTLTCNLNSLQLTGSSPTAGVSYSWTGPAGFSSNQQNPTVTVAGTYTLTVTDPSNGCTSTDTTQVNEDANLPGAMASGGTLTCNLNSLQLTGSSPTAGVNYNWTGPAGFSSNQQNPTVTVAGTYTLTVTDPSNGCTSTDTAQVNEDANLPGAMASGGTLTCNLNSLQLMGSSTTAGVNYNWTGPAGFNSNQQNPTVTVAGTYTLTVTDPSNGCTSTDTAQVNEDANLPGAMASGGTLTCNLNSLQLMGSSTTAGVNYNWTGPAGFSSNQQNPTVTVAGTYTLTVTDPSNGCTSTDTAQVNEDANLPGAMASGGTLTCNLNSLQLTGSSPTAGVNYNWTGPAGFNSNQQNPTVTVAGTYTLTVTDPANGCTSTDTAQVNEDANLPGAMASGGTLTCNLNSLQLMGSSTTAGVNYNWTGPAGFSSNQQNPTVTVAGTYTLTVTDPSNGCTSTDTAQVSLNQNVPGVMASGGSINCTNSSVQLLANSPTPGVSYSWTGPGGFSSTQQNPTVFVAGTYTVIVTNPLNGCTSSDTAQVNEDANLPGAIATGGTLTCNLNSLQLMGSSPTTGVNYSWTGPAGFSSNQQNPSVTVAGTYTLTVTNPSNGCTSTDTAQVNEDANLPGAIATGGTLTCNLNSLQLMGSSPTTGVNYSWTGPAGFSSNQQNPSVTVAGTYTLTVTNPSNGCTSTDTAQVNEDANLPGAVATGGTLTCNLNSLQLMGSSPTTGVNYSWTGPAGFSSNQQNPSVTVAGTYTLTVTDPSNGCTSTDTAQVNEDANLPGAVATGGTLTCAQNSLQLMGSSPTAGVSYSWTGPAGFSSNQQNPSITVAGTYTLTVTDPSNGCTSTDTAQVNEDLTPPANVLATGGEIACGGSNVQLSGSSTTTGVDFAWTGPNGFTSSLQNPVVSDTGIYTLTVTNPVNGCTASDTALVTQEICGSCLADAGTLSPADTCSEICQIGNVATINAIPDGNQQIPAGYEILYLLVSHPSNNVVQKDDFPSFNVAGLGTYSIHTLIYDPNAGSSNFLDTALIVLGTTTINDVQNIINPLCADLDLVGVSTTVVVCNPPIALDDFNNTIKGVAVSGNVLTNDVYPFGTIEADPNPVSGPSNGTVVINPDGSYTYTPDPAFVGEDEFTYRACDNTKCPPVCATAIVFIEVLESNMNLNVAPTANGDAVITEESTELTLLVLSNDFDLNGDAIQNPVPVSLPSHGKVVYNNNGTVTYTPDPGYVGEDQFMYSISDEGVPSLSDVAVVSIEIIEQNAGNDAPIAVDDAAATGMDQPVRVNLAANDIETEGDILVYKMITNPVNGTVEDFNPISGVFVYSPKLSFTGTDQFIYSVCDDEGCSRATVYFTVIEDQINQVLVEWLAFKVKQVDRDAQLKWGTNIEVNTTHFEVERSLDGFAFERIGFVTAAGYSTDPNSYDYVDKNVAGLLVNKLYYRIKLIHMDGTFSYSTIEELTILPDPDIGITVYPNPAFDEVIISYSANEAVEELLIYNAIGQLIYSHKPQDGSLEGDMKMRIGAWSTGLYYVQIFTVRGNGAQHLLIKPED